MATKKTTNTETNEKQEELYVSKAKVVSIRATSRASVKIKDNYFTVEFSEERMIPDIKGVDLEEERALLWDTVNDECDNQVDWLRKNL